VAAFVEVGSDEAVLFPIQLDTPIMERVGQFSGSFMDFLISP